MSLFFVFGAQMNFAQIDNSQSTQKTVILFSSEATNLFLDYPQKSGEPLILRVSGVLQISEEAAQKILAVYVFNKVKNRRASLPVQGVYKIKSGQIEFAPDFDFVSNTFYEAEIDGRAFGLGKTYRERFSIPGKSNLSVPQVTQIYPTVDNFPANILRFYVYFSEPMRRQTNRSLIKLKDEAGKEISAAFVVLNQELWSADGRRLTVLFDPGRIKRGVAANTEKGLALEAGKSYQLLIEAGWTSEAGAASGKSFIKKFRAAEADRTPLDPKKWKIEAPPNSTKQPLKISIERVLDYALLEDSLLIVDESGRRIAGVITVQPGEQNLIFTPRDQWTAGNYKVIVAFDLEDTAGNRIGEALDHDADDQNVAGQFYEIPFSVN